MHPTWIFLIVLAIILLVSRILIYLITRGTRSGLIRANLSNILKVIIRIIGVSAIILSIFVVYDVDLQALEIISISSIGGAFIGFASSEVMNQIVSGIYLITTRPFGVHDLVQINDVTGIVMEIGLNYTIIQKMDGNITKIPNKTILDSKIKNFTIKLTDEIRKRQKHLNRTEQVDIRNVTPEGARKGKIDWKKLHYILDDLTDFAFEEEITRFVFDFDTDFSISPQKVRDRIDNVCKKYQAVFEHLPQYKLMNLDFRPEFKMFIYCFSPFVILHNYDSFMLDLAHALYAPEEGVME